MTCNARQVNDQKICGVCGLQWDVNDPEPPKCPVERLQRAGRTITIRPGTTIQATCVGAGGAGCEVALPPSSVSPGAPTTNFLFASGKADPFPLSRADRRYHVVEPRTSAPTQVACRPPRPIAALIPTTLAPDVAYAMAKSYEESRANGSERIGAMHAAYKAFLDSLRK